MSSAICLLLRTGRELLSRPGSSAIERAGHAEDDSVRQTKLIKEAKWGAGRQGCSGAESVRLSKFEPCLLVGEFIHCAVFMQIVGILGWLWTCRRRRRRRRICDGAGAEGDRALLPHTHNCFSVVKLNRQLLGPLAVRCHDADVFNTF
jgi:hypothetical protein